MEGWQREAKQKVDKGRWREKCRSWASAPLALLLFLPFKELHKLEEIMSALKQAEKIKQRRGGGGEKVCERVRED